MSHKGTHKKRELVFWIVLGVIILGLIVTGIVSAICIRLGEKNVDDTPDTENPYGGDGVELPTDWF